MVDRTSAEQKDRILYDAIAEGYFRKDTVGSSSKARKYKLFSAMHRVLCEKDNLGTVVEVGCGAGATARYLKGLYDSYIGIDQSQELITRARVFNKGNDNAIFISENIKSDTLPQDCADVIFASGALHHMTDLDDVMENLAKIARKGGYLVVIEPQDTNKLIQLMRLARGFVDKSYSQEQVFFSPEYLKELFVAHGIVDISLEFQGFFSTPFAEVILNPQFLFEPLSKAAISIDGWLDRYLPYFIRKQSYNIIISGRFS